jgi:hypothetical protein
MQANFSSDDNELQLDGKPRAFIIATSAFQATLREWVEELLWRSLACSSCQKEPCALQRW